jgi:BirA family biotin operon repressor/biotin-[acetyl-CoA-carboxylase] ligase
VIVPERVRSLLGSGSRFTTIESFPSIDSTNRLVTDRAAGGAPEGLVVTAEVQTAGRGRLDRSWEAEAGSALLVSVLVRPADLPVSRWFLVGVAAGVAAREACQQVGGFVPDLKWPNDLLVGERKLAGILAEATGTAAVVGMGLNVHGAPPGAAWADQAAGRRLDRAALLAAWLRGFDRRLGRWDELLAAYRQACATLGQDVIVEHGNGRLVGRAEAIDDDGRLVLHLADGTRVAVTAGDVIHVRPAPAPAPAASGLGPGPPAAGGLDSGSAAAGPLPGARKAPQDSPEGR